jgi:hypothetical protein
MSGFELVGLVFGVLPIILDVVKEFDAIHPSSHVEDYWHLAREVNQKPEIGIFRRFGELNNFSLLYMQAEIASLEKKLLSQREKDANSSCEITQSYNFSMDRLRESNGEGGKTQLNLLTDIQAKLKIYSEHLSLKQRRFFVLTEYCCRRFTSFSDTVQSPKRARKC